MWALCAFSLFYFYCLHTSINESLDYIAMFYWMYIFLPPLDYEILHGKNCDLSICISLTTSLFISNCSTNEQIIIYPFNKFVLITQFILINYFTYLPQKTTSTFYLFYPQHLKGIADTHINVQKDAFLE